MPSERRLHPLAIVFDVGRQIGALAIPLLLLVFGIGSDGLDSEVTALVVLVPYAGIAVGRYLSYRYSYGERDFIVRWGLIFKKERHIPYERIQNIDAVQNVLHRMFGVVEVRVQTGSGNEAEATLGAVPIAALEEMRGHVFARRTATAATVAPGPGVEAAPTPAAHAVLQLAPRELVLYGLIENRGLIVIAAAFGLLWEIGATGGFLEGLIGDEAAARGAVRSIARLATGGGDVSTRALIAVPVVVLLFLLVSRLFSIGWALVKLHGFTLSRIGEDLRTEYGLLTRVTATVPLRRVQTVTIKEGLLHRLCGRASVGVSTAGGSGGEASRTQREWLAPILRRDAVPALLTDVLPGVDLSSVDWQRVHPRAFRRAIKGRLVAAAVACAMSWWVLGPRGLALAPVVLVWAVVAARLYVTRLGWATTGDAVLFRRGAFSRAVTIARFVKIQAVELHESPFDRRTGMLTVRVDTAGASEGFGLTIPFVPRPHALELGQMLATQASETTFRW